MFAVLKGIIIICLRSACDLYGMFIKVDIKVYARDLIPRALANNHYHLVGSGWHVSCQLKFLLRHTFLIIPLISTRLSDTS